MTDDFLSRAWADGHRHYSDQIADAVGDAAHAVKVGLDRLNRYEFDAPWQRDLKRKRLLNSCPTAAGRGTMTG